MHSPVRILSFEVSFRCRRPLLVVLLLAGCVVSGAVVGCGSGVAPAISTENEVGDAGG